MNTNTTTRKRKVAKALLFGVPTLIVMACASGGGGDDDESVGGSKDEKGGGGSGEVGNWDILTKPQFGQQYGMFDTVKIKVKNVSDSEDEPWLEIRLTNKKGDLVTTFDCIGRTVEPGQTTTLECSSLDDYAAFTDYEIRNAF